MESDEIEWLRKLEQAKFEYEQFRRARRTEEILRVHGDDLVKMASEWDTVSRSAPTLRNIVDFGKKYGDLVTKYNDLVSEPSFESLVRRTCSFNPPLLHCITSDMIVELHSRHPDQFELRFTPNV